MRHPRLWSISVLLLLIIAPVGARAADKYTETITRFRNAGQSAEFFKSSYGYAVFPTIGKAGLGLGGAHGGGRVYRQGVYTGDASVTQVSVGWQAGIQAYSMIVFFECLSRCSAIGNEWAVRVRSTGERGRDHGGRVGAGHDRGTGSRCQHELGQREYGGRLPQGYGGLQRREGRPHVRGQHRRPEVRLPAEEEVTPCGGAITFRRPRLSTA